MLLRSSSTPVLGSLLSSFSESPYHHHHHHNPEPHTTIKRPPTPIHQTHNKLISFHPAESLNHTTVSRNPSPSISEFSDGGRLSQTGFRRAQSEGNLEGLVNASCNHDEFSISNPPKRFSRRTNSSMLETIPSFSYHHARTRYDDDEDSYDEEEEEEEEEEENYSLAVRGSELNLEKENLSLNHEMRFFNAYRSLGFEENKKHSSEMYLAKGLGVDSSVNIGFGGGGGGGEHNRGGGGIGDGGGNRPGIEEHYKRLVEEHPGNPLFLRNYAQFLYESKQDLPKAEEYYSRAIVADPKDGEVLSQYAKLVWELHHDQDTASSYFERAVHAAPEDSHVHAAYASFLWETEEDEDEDDAPNDPGFLPSRFQTGAMASASA